MALEVFGETAAAADPGESGFDDPAFGENDKAMHLVAFDDLDGPGAGLYDGGRHDRPLSRPQRSRAEYRRAAP